MKPLFVTAISLLLSFNSIAYDATPIGDYDHYNDDYSGNAQERLVYKSQFIFLKNYDLSRNITNQKPHPDNGTKSGTITVKTEKKAGKYKVIKQISYNIGLGVGVSGWYQYPSSVIREILSATVGLIPVKYSKVKYVRFANTLKKAKKISLPKIPYKAKELRSYTKGEKIIVESTGGINYIFEFGAPLHISAGYSHIILGGWKTKIVKTGEHTAVVTIQNKNITKATVYSGMKNVTEVYNIRLKQVEEGFSYKFNFDQATPEVITAYEQMVMGNIVPAQQLSAVENSGVTYTVKIGGLKEMRSRGFGFGVPMLLTLDFMRGKIYQQSDVTFQKDGSRWVEDYGIIFKGKYKRFIHKHRSMERTFYATAGTKFDKDNDAVDSYYIGTYSWNYETDQEKGNRLLKTMNKFKKEMGLIKNLNFRFDGNKKARIGYAAFDGIIIFGQDFTNKLITIAKTNTLVQSSNKLIKNYFRSNRDHLDLCRDYEAERGTSGLTAKCYNRYKHDTKKAIKKINQGLKNMSRHLANDDNKKFVVSYAKVGKLIFDNYFLIETVKKLDAECDVYVEVYIHGQTFMDVERYFPFNESCR